MKNISVDSSYRWSDYNLSGSSSTYKFGVNWAVTSDFRVRGAYARTERAPSIVELLYPTIDRRCAVPRSVRGVEPNLLGGGLLSLVELAAAGVSEAQFANNIYGRMLDCPAGACNSKTGGNPELQPEVAHTTTAGMVLTPSFVPGLLASVDYWDINVLNAVGTLSARQHLAGLLRIQYLGALR